MTLKLMKNKNVLIKFKTTLELLKMRAGSEYSFLISAALAFCRNLSRNPSLRSQPLNLKCSRDIFRDVPQLFPCPQNRHMR